MTKNRRQHLHTQIVRKFIADISCGIFAHGERLPAERLLSEQFQVSRNTIRQALSDLERMDAIEIKHGSGAYVKKVSLTKMPTDLLPRQISNVSLRDIITARKAIEISAVKLACECITNRQLHDLQELLNEMDDLIDNLPEYFLMDMKFHTSIVKASGNIVLATAFEAIFEYHKYSQIFTSENDQCEKLAMKHHWQIYQCLTKRDSQAAVTALTRHLDSITGTRAVQ